MGAKERASERVLSATHATREREGMRPNKHECECELMTGRVPSLLLLLSMPNKSAMPVPVLAAIASRLGPYPCF